jgi:hypothetical protein
MDALSSPRHWFQRQRHQRSPAAIAAATLVAATLATLPPRRAAGLEARQVMTGHPLDRIVAGANRLFALGGGEVRTFDGDGETLGRCAGFAPPPATGRRAALGGLEPDEVLRAAGLPDDDSTPEAEEALEDEGLESKRRTGPQPQSDGGILPHAIAAGGTSDAVWIATSAGLFRGDENGCLPAGLDGRDLLLVAAAGGALVAATDTLLFRRAPNLDGDGGGGDGDGDGATFTAVSGLTERPRALALAADGAALVADDGGILMIGGDGTTARILDRPTDAVAVCGDVAIALSDDGVYRWTAGTAPARTSDRPPIRAIACGPPGPERWIGSGLGIWTSPDGTTWTERTEGLGRRVTGAATVGRRVWLAIDDELVAFDPTRGEQEVRRSALSATPDGFAPVPTRHLLPPTLPWPEITALFGLGRRPDRRSWQVMMLLTFPLGRAAGRHVDPTALAAESARRDQALAREEIDLAAEPEGGTNDGETNDEELDRLEREARLDSLRREREALR